jgi:hypothetical protein
MKKLCSGSTERKIFAGSLCLAAAALTGIGAIDHGHHVCYGLDSDQCFAMDSLMTAANLFLGIFMLMVATQRPSKASSR